MSVTFIFGNNNDYVCNIPLECVAHLLPNANDRTVIKMPSIRNVAIAQAFARLYLEQKGVPIEKPLADGSNISEPVLNFLKTIEAEQNVTGNHAQAATCYYMFLAALEHEFKDEGLIHVICWQVAKLMFKEPLESVGLSIEKLLGIKLKDM